MDVKHTPGPWAVEQGTGYHVGDTVITARHAGMTSMTPLARISNVLGIDGAAPDANLIAVAPDLREHLENMVEWFSGFEHGDLTSQETIRQAREVLARATP